MTPKNRRRQHWRRGKTIRIERGDPFGAETPEDAYEPELVDPRPGSASRSPGSEDAGPFPLHPPPPKPADQDQRVINLAQAALNAKMLLHSMDVADFPDWISPGLPPAVHKSISLALVELFGPGAQDYLLFERDRQERG